MILKPKLKKMFLFNKNLKDFCFKISIFEFFIKIIEILNKMNYPQNVTMIG
jgi:hypothetical protein